MISAPGRVSRRWHGGREEAEVRLGHAENPSAAGSTPGAI